MTDQAQHVVARADDDPLNRLIAGVLMVPLEAVSPDVDLVYELGAESIDFLDLLFSLDELVGGRVLPETWSGWLRERLPESQAGQGITPAILAEFVAYQRSVLSAPASEGAA